MPVNHSWRNDPRIQSMDPEKIRFLTELSDQIRHTPKNRLMNRFLSMNLEAQKQGISFSDQETDLLTEILVEYLDPADRGRLDLLRMLSKKISSRK